MQYAQQWHRKVVAISMALVCLTLGLRAGLAQSSQKPTKEGEPSLHSVSVTTLKPYVDRTVTIHGIIGDYHGDKSHYYLGTDDGASIEVVGTYPDVGHVNYTLHARVENGNGKYRLQELSKERDSTVVGSKSDPLLIAGIALIVAAVITLGIMVSKNRAAQQRMVMEHQIDEERRRTEAARADAERARIIAERISRPDGPGATVVAGSAAKPKPAHTIISVGALEVVSGPHLGAKFPLQHGETRIGRSSDNGCQVVLDRDGEVSGYHGSVVVTVDGRLIYKDESTNGSILDGKTIHHGQAEAASGAVLNIGGSTLRFTIRGSGGASQSAAEQSGAIGEHAVSNAAAPEARTGTPLISAPTVEVDTPFTPPKRPAPATQLGFGAEFVTVPGAAAERRFYITRPVSTIGREDRDILLEDDTVSRKHATLTVREGVFVLTDDGSTHGTRVNGDPVGPSGCALSDGDLVVFGSGATTLVFHRMAPELEEVHGT